MYVILRIRRCNQKKQGNRFAIQRIKIDTARNDHCRKPGPGHCITFPVGNRNSFPNAGRGFFFSCKNLLPVSFFVSDLAALYHERNCLFKRLLFVRRRSPQHHASFIEQIRNSHNSSVLKPLILRNVLFSTMLRLQPGSQAVRKMRSRFRMQSPCGMHIRNPFFQGILR